ncbi:hypothetical protein G6F47_002066 [Rhizopus delemar]|nr:hypothetical protein G6F54_006147 [Rhizopus delemar]KAG1510648.1 hypothetical protein G6F53_006530 [Rhizopus delemar]KAG1558405.1 hypothetical protein G6F49_004536 [Rhizopus delemar]KAG1593193.1 hypothetical protein G6F48_002163 [Rhizopus delemar]KAG1603187.1 hypothetical protein G6F47_002066 [Rhizopus delemar]
MADMSPPALARSTFASVPFVVSIVCGWAATWIHEPSHPLTDDQTRQGSNRSRTHRPFDTPSIEWPHVSYSCVESLAT